MRLNFYVNNLDISKVTSFFKPIIKAYKTCAKASGQKHKAIELNITFLTDDEIHAINKEQRGIDKPTDVLSFPMLEKIDKKICKKNYPYDYDIQSKTVFLGDIFISMETAKAQAKKYNHSLLREVVFLALHGFLHCLGFDHMTKKEEKIMFSLQEYVLNKCGIKR